MKLQKVISLLSGLKRRSSDFSPVERNCLAVVLVIAASTAAAGKDASVTAVVLFEGPHGTAYVQITDATLNGKVEVRLCEGVSKLDKNGYNGLPRTTLVGAKSLQRGADGVLTLTVNDKPLCVVPSNLKFDRRVEITPAEAAEQAVIQGTPIAASPRDSLIPALKPGVQLVFIAAPDLELADFLRAGRASTVKDWQDFVVRYPSSTRLRAAQSAIAGLHQQAAEAAFAQYQKAGGAGKQDLAVLRQACMEAQAANQVSPGYKPAFQLMDSVSRELDNLLASDAVRLQAYRKALQEHTSGYSQLAAATVHVERLFEVRPDYAPSLNLRREIAAEESKLETTVANAESQTAAARYDQAVSTLGPYSSFASEIPRVDAVFSAAFKYHLNNGQRLADQQDWERAVPEFRKAAAIRPDSKEAEAALNNAATQLSAQRDQQAANLALLQSNDYARKNQFVEAYNVLADLPDKQRTLVTSQLSALSRNYVSAATRRAQTLQEAHIPIKSRADEDAVLEAYVLWDRASSLSGDPAITVKRDFLSSKISAYYVDQANRYLQKPSGSGAGVGWLYLKQARRYGITNLDSLKDQTARYEPLYQRRAHLSVGIMLRDQTSRRDGPGLADQLADAIANGLDSSAVLVEVVRKPSEVEDALQPNFTLVGEVLEDRVVKNASLEAPQSKYRASTQEIRNPVWLQTESDYAAAQQQLASAQSALADAQAQHKKKEVVAAANDAVQEAQKHADELKHTLETTDQNRVETVLEPYHYTKKTIALSASVVLAFRFSDRTGNVIGQPGDVRKDNRKSTVVVQDVKPEDTEGITNQGVEPDETQFLTDLEIDARNAMVKAVQEKAAEVLAGVLQEARALAQRGDVDGAAEQYVLYLNSTPETVSAERDEAARFLHDRFNLAVPADTKL
jgi:tetratricopeptide (TPR) repeat protein